MTQEESPEQPRRDGISPAKHRSSWPVLVGVMVLAAIAALVLAYLITVRNFPAH